MRNLNRNPHPNRKYPSPVEPRMLTPEEGVQLLEERVAALNWKAGQESPMDVGDLRRMAALEVFDAVIEKATERERERQESRRRKSRPYFDTVVQEAFDARTENLMGNLREVVYEIDANYQEIVSFTRRLFEENVALRNRLGISLDAVLNEEGEVI